MRTIFGTVFAAASVGCLLVGTACAGVWHKYEGNPVLGGESLGACFDVNVVTNGPAPYTMYFSRHQDRLRPGAVLFADEMVRGDACRHA